MNDDNRAHRAPAAGRRAVGVPAGEARSADLRPQQAGREVDLCSSVSGLAALGSRSRRPSRPPRCCGAPAWRSRSSRSRPPATATARSPFGQIGARGVFVKEIEEALLAGRIDVAVHSAKDMTSTDTDGLVVGAYLERDDPRDALDRRRRDPSGHAHRHRVRAPARAAPRARADALDRAAARERRHAPAQAARARARRDRARRLRARPARAAATRSARASIRRVMLPEAAQGALALQVRAGEEERVAARRTMPRRAAGSSRSARCVATIGAGCLAPVAAHHDGSVAAGADRGRGRRAGSSGAAATIPRRSRGAGRARRGARRGRRAVRVIVTRPRAQAGPLVARLEQLGAEVVECPLIEIERTSDEPVDARRLRLARRHEPERRRRDRAPRAQPAAGRGGRAGHRRGAARARHRAGVRAASSRRRTACCASSRGPPGRVLFAAAEGARRRPIDALDADFVPLYRTRLLTPDAARGRRRRARLRLGRARVRRGRRRGACGHDRPGDVARRSLGAGLTVAARGGVARSRRPRRRGRESDGLADDDRHHLPDRLRPAGRLRRHLPRRDRAHRAGRARDRHHARHRAAGGAAGRARPAQHDRLHAGGRAPCGRRSRRRRRTPRDRRAHRRRARVRRPGQRPADARRRAVRDRRRRTSSSTSATGCRTCRAPSTHATSSRRRPRISRPACRSRSSARRSSRRSSCASTCPTRRSAGRRSRRPCSRSTASATSRRTPAVAHLDGLGVANGDRVEIRLDARPLLRRRRRARSRTRRPAS